MEQGHLTNHIAADPSVLAGKPIIKGTRLAVSFIVGLLGQGMTIEEIIEEWPELEEEDIQQALCYASHAMEERIIPLVENSIS